MLLKVCRLNEYRLYSHSNENTDTHQPKLIESKWYTFWQKKLKELNDKVTFDL
jgi:hypothetical protein